MSLPFLLLTFFANSWFFFFKFFHPCSTTLQLPGCEAKQWSPGALLEEKATGKCQLRKKPKKIVKCCSSKVSCGQHWILCLSLPTVNPQRSSTVRVPQFPPAWTEDKSEIKTCCHYPPSTLPTTQPGGSCCCVPSVSPPKSSCSLTQLLHGP